MPTTDAQLRNLTEPGKYFDGRGLYLELTKAGGKYWRLKYSGKTPPQGKPTIAPRERYHPSAARLPLAR